MPASNAASTTEAVPAASIRQPKLLQPTPTRETLRDPTFRYSMNEFLSNRLISNVIADSSARIQSISWLRHILHCAPKSSVTTTTVKKQADWTIVYIVGRRFEHWIFWIVSCQRLRP